jgi:hypothetical protein
LVFGNASTDQTRAVAEQVADVRAIAVAVLSGAIGVGALLTQRCLNGIRQLA